MSKFVIVDVEADGPCPGLYSIVSFGAIIVDKDLNKTFYGQCSPISDKWKSDALAISGLTREQHLTSERPEKTFYKFNEWLKTINNRQIFLSDNLAFDWQFINYYFHRFIGNNPFGFSGRRINDIYSGLVGNLKASNDWKKLRITRHNHNPVKDAKGNAEAFIKICGQYNLKYD
jgi:DNA polymerase III epsilon subunit-like protein